MRTLCACGVLLLAPWRCDTQWLRCEKNIVTDTLSQKCCDRSAMTEVSFSARGMVYSGKCWKRNPQALFQQSTCVFVLFSCVRLIMPPRGVAFDCNYPVNFCGNAAATAKCGRLVIVKLRRLIVVSSLHSLNWVLSLFVLLPLLNSANEVRQKDSVAISYVPLCQAMRRERCGHLGRGTYLNKATNGADCPGAALLSGLNRKRHRLHGARANATLALWEILMNISTQQSCISWICREYGERRTKTHSVWPSKHRWTIYCHCCVLCKGCDRAWSCSISWRNTCSLLI